MTTNSEDQVQSENNSVPSLLKKEEVSRLKDEAKSNSDDINKHMTTIQSMLDDIKARTWEAKCQLEARVTEERNKHVVRKAIPVKALAANRNVRKANLTDQSRDSDKQPFAQS